MRRIADEADIAYDDDDQDKEVGKDAAPRKDTLCLFVVITEKVELQKFFHSCS